MALDGRDREVQRCGDLGRCRAVADGERDVALARAQRRQEVARVFGAGAGERDALGEADQAGPGSGQRCGGDGPPRWAARTS